MEDEDIDVFEISTAGFQLDDPSSLLMAFTCSSFEAEDVDIEVLEMSAVGLDGDVAPSPACFLFLIPPHLKRTWMLLKMSFSSITLCRSTVLRIQIPK